MTESYIARSIEPVLKRAADEFPAVAVTGPRQSGKTTLLQQLFGESHRYVSLEPPDIRAAANADPRAFLEMFRPPVIFDEAQNAPSLFPYIKERIDADRHNAGQYLLTGSQNLSLAEDINESLAGRIAMLRLLPLSRREAEGRPDLFLPWETQRSPAPVGRFTYDELWKAFLRGGFPELCAHPNRDVALWHGSYIQTYLERDVRALRHVGDLTGFHSFLQVLAARSGQLLNLTGIARDLGLAVNTIKAWISVLEATYQVFVLRPYHANVGKRLVKTAKVYFTDTGTLCHLAGLRDTGHAASGPMGDAIMETAVLSEIVKASTHRGIAPQVFFWRTLAGTEVDLVMVSEGKLVPIEVKLSATPRPGMAASIRTMRADFGDRAMAGYVVHPGDVQLPLGPGVTAHPFAGL
ncbi:MAG: ATP-binding protein [Rhodospirillales bacterium]|nr:ATP-binding protein [Rhodospirillales bacterium]